jgi:hypothetical protein
MNFKDKSAELAEVFDFGCNTYGFNRKGWMSCACGLIAAAIIYITLPRITFIGQYFVILVHEFGHAAVGWLFGYLSIPAFDLKYGGGVASLPPRQMLLLIIPYGIAGWAMVKSYRQIPLISGLIILTAIHSALAFTNGHIILFTFMGHGTEALIAGLFVYRSLSRKCVMNPMERPIYALLGWFTFIHLFHFSYKLLTDKVEQIMYGFGKGGITNDFILLARQLNISMKSVIVLFMIYAFCCMLIAFTAYFVIDRHGRCVLDDDEK